MNYWQQYKIWRSRALAHAEKLTEELEAEIFNKFVERILEDDRYTKYHELSNENTNP